MNLRQLLITAVLSCFASVAAADLEAWTDYDISNGLSNVTTVNVDSNMIDKYLEGLRDTWAPANEVAIKLGQIESYSIFVSDLPNGGDFNAKAPETGFGDGEVDLQFASEVLELVVIH